MINKKEILKNIKFNAVFAGVSSIVSYFIFFLMARYVSIETFSSYNLGVALVSGVRVFVSYAADQCFTDYTIKSKSENQSYSVTIKLFAYNTLILLFFGVLYSLYKEIDYLRILFLVVPAYYIGFLFEYKQKILVFNIINLLERTLFLVTFGFCLLYDNIRPIFILYFSTTTISLFMQICYFRSTIFKIKWKWDFHQVADYYRIYFPIFLINICFLIYGQIGKVYFDNLDDSKTVNLITFILQVSYLWMIYSLQFEKVCKVPLYKAIKFRNVSDIKYYIKFFIVKNLMPCIGVFTCVSLFRHYIAALFPQYSYEIPNLFIVTIFLMPIVICNKFLEILLIGLGRKGYLLVINLTFSFGFCFFLFCVKITKAEEYFVILQVFQIAQACASSYVAYKAFNRISI